MSSASPYQARFALCVAASVAFACLWAAPAGAKVSVTTYHNDNARTGWNAKETILTPSAVAGGGFNVIASASLDDQVDAQPLVRPHQTISGHGTHDVVYVATESNTIYAIDANTGQILLSNNFGTPVPWTMLPGGCGNNGPYVGINSTPVIDPSSSTLYAVTYTLENNHQTFRIHALDLSTLADKTPSVVISASAALTNGQTYNFDPVSSRQRAGLLLANGNVYAGFASFCDENANLSRGWVLGWQTGSLAPLASNHLNNTRASAPDNFFLTSIWMSGYGLAASRAGDIYFVTGNSDYSGNTYNAQTNLSESVVALSPDLMKVQTYFTPGGRNGADGLDSWDGDLGSGGVMLLPPQPGSVRNMATAAGKDGNIYLMNAGHLGKQGLPLDGNYEGSCWCGPSYFTGSDGIGRIVASGGTKVGIWQVQTRQQGNPQLALQAQSASVPNGQDGGFFTSVSSNGTTANSAVIWAISRPTDANPADIYLYAFDDAGNTLFSGLAGNWPNVGGNSNTVPTVANGKVYVASDQALAIFGLGAPAKLPPVKLVDMRAALAPGQHEVHGVVKSINGNLITVAKRDGATAVIDCTLAEKKFRMAEPAVGHGLLARGTFDAIGILHADTLLHAKDRPSMWQGDR